MRLPDPYELGQEFFRWEFATAVAGSVLGINPFDQPNVQEAKDRDVGAAASGESGSTSSPRAPSTTCCARRCPGTTSQSSASSTPSGKRSSSRSSSSAQSTGCPVTKGLGPRYLHSTGQLHKGGPDTGVFVQVVDDLGDDVKIPGRKFGFKKLIAAQAAGDFEALQERGRRIVRVAL